MFDCQNFMREIKVIDAQEYISRSSLLEMVAKGKKIIGVESHSKNNNIYSVLLRNEHKKQQIKWLYE